MFQNFVNMCDSMFSDDKLEKLLMDLTQFVGDLGM